MSYNSLDHVSVRYRIGMSASGELREVLTGLLENPDEYEPELESTAQVLVDHKNVTSSTLYGAERYLRGTQFDLAAAAIHFSGEPLAQRRSDGTEHRLYLPVEHPERLADISSALEVIPNPITSMTLSPRLYWRVATSALKYDRHLRRAAQRNLADTLRSTQPGVYAYKPVILQTVVQTPAIAYQAPGYYDSYE